MASATKLRIPRRDESRIVFDDLLDRPTRCNRDRWSSRRSCRRARAATGMSAPSLTVARAAARRSSPAPHQETPERPTPTDPRRRDRPASLPARRQASRAAWSRCAARSGGNRRRAGRQPSAVRGVRGPRRGLASACRPPVRPQSLARRSRSRPPAVRKPFARSRAADASAPARSSDSTPISSPPSPMAKPRDRRDRRRPRWHSVLVAELARAARRCP